MTAKAFSSERGLFFVLRAKVASQGGGREAGGQAGFRRGSSMAEGGPRGCAGNLGRGG